MEGEDTVEMGVKTRKIVSSIYATDEIFALLWVKELLSSQLKTAFASHVT